MSSGSTEPSWFPSDDEAVYVYAIAPLPLPELAIEAGIEDRAVHWLQHNAFGVAASVVEPADWTGEAGAEHMKDLTWVGPRAYQHEQVVEAVTDALPAVFPARFGTLFSTPARVRATLDARADTLHDFLAAVDGMEEWAVKGLLDRAKATDRAGDAAAEAASGTDYLQRRKQQEEAEGALEDRLDDVAESLFESLAESAGEARVLPVPGEAGRDQEVAFNWAFLVPTAAREAFQEAVERQSERYAERGLTLDLTGPWPPYNFRPSLDEEE